MNAKEQQGKQISRVDRAARIVDRALELNRTERNTYIQVACGDDVELRKEVEAMLEAHEEAGESLAAPTTNENAATIHSFPNEEPGTVIDRYKILQLIGEGGFGAVYMAEQQEPVKRRVALKIIKLGMDTKQVIARFEAERQALAMMSHPNIAAVLDAGSTETGRPYFVMELVKGIPITEYCDQNNLTVHARLDLFKLVCAAVQHAHQKGIIHRDIKPSNVMVTLHDGKPVPKVIDFGIAKAMNRELTDKTLFTEYRQMVGTPQYMSPEQAEMSGLDIDTRSDIYSLGVLLYELLTGTTPFDPKRLRSAGLNEIQRIIREEEPQKPSTRVSTLDTLPSIAAHRNIEPRKLGLQIRGDLDWIIMKALEKDRTRRYETATGFADDIGRHVRNEPVLASPPSAAYRLSKFVRRNRTSVTGVIVIAVVLLAATGVSIGFAISEAAQRRIAQMAEREQSRARMAETKAKEEAQDEQVQAVAARKEADERADRIEEIMTVLDTVLGSLTDEEKARGESPSTFDVSPQGSTVRGMLKSFDDEPILQARALSLLGSTFRLARRYDYAQTALQAALDLRRKELGESHELVADSLSHWASLLHDRREYEEALGVQKQALQIRQNLLGKQDLDNGYTHLAIVDQLGHLGRFMEVAPHAKAALDILEAELGEENSTTLRSMDLLSEAYFRTERYFEAEPILRRQLAIYQRMEGPHEEKISVAKNHLGRVLVRTQRFGEGEVLMREVVSAYASKFGEEKWQTDVARVYLCACLIGKENYEEAEPILKTAYERLRRDWPPTDHDVRFALSQLATLYYKRGDYEEAEKWKTRWVAAFSTARTQKDAKPSELNRLAWMLLTSDPQPLRDPAAALSAAEQACDLEERANGNNLWVYLDTLSLAQHMTGDTSQAIETQKRAISLITEDVDPAMRAEAEQRLAKYEAATESNDKPTIRPADRPDDETIGDGR